MDLDEITSCGCGHNAREHAAPGAPFCLRTGCGCQVFTPIFSVGAANMPTLRERDHILNAAKKIISGAREASYGDARTDFTRTGAMWAAVLGLPAITPEQVALCMMAVKIGRLCESPGHADSWIDICGYAALGGEIGTAPQ